MNGLVFLLVLSMGACLGLCLSGLLFGAAREDRMSEEEFRIRRDKWDNR